MQPFVKQTPSQKPGLARNLFGASRPTPKSNSKGSQQKGQTKLNAFFPLIDGNSRDSDPSIISGAPARSASGGAGAVAGSGQGVANAAVSSRAAAATQLAAIPEAPERSSDATTHKVRHIHTQCHAQYMMYACMHMHVLDVTCHVERV